MPEDVGGRPFPGEDPDGEEPELHHAAADDEFATVVFDEDFVRSATVHEPTAAERILAAAQSHAEAEAARGFEDGYGYGPGQEGELDPDAGTDGEEDPDDEGRFDRSDYSGRPDYSGYSELSDGDGFVPYGPYSTFGRRTPYGPHNSYAEYADYTAYTMRVDAADEHGSDYGYPYRGAHAASGRYRGHFRWQRPVAWVLAVVMGIGVVALALSAVYRGASSTRQDPTPPPATTGVGATDSGHASVTGRGGAPALPRGQYAAPPRSPLPSPPRTPPPPPIPAGAEPGTR